MKREQVKELPTFSRFDEAVKHAEAQTLRAIDDLKGGFKYCNSIHNSYPEAQNDDWTQGLWTGEINVVWELTGNEFLKHIALKQLDSYQERLRKKINIDTHDLGFIFSPSCVAAWKLYGLEQGREIALVAARALAGRFQEKGRFIQAWGPMGEKGNYRLIIDCLLNIPLLFWASEETGEQSFRRIAEAHFDSTRKNALRPDGSSYHTFFFDPETGKPLYGQTHQGNRNDSAWARGQAWAIYGPALYYRYTKDSKARTMFEKTLAFFLDHLPDSVIPYWDFDFTDGSTEPKDSSALAIAICGMLEMSDLTGDSELRSLASRLFGKLYESCAVKDPKISNGQLLHGVYCRKTPTNDARDRGVDECNTWGDYFYVEALMRLKRPGWRAYW